MSFRFKIQYFLSLKKNKNGYPMQVALEIFDLKVEIKYILFEKDNTYLLSYM